MVDVEKLKAAIKEHTERLINDPVAMAEWRKQFISPWVELEGEEKDHMYLVLKFLTPYDSSNDQRTITNYYKHAGKEYRMTSFDYDVMIEIKEEDE